MASISNISNTFRRVSQKGLDLIPNRVISGEKLLNNIQYIGKNFSSDKQRLALGLTAIVTQPVIDAKNKNVDEKTRSVSVSRTIAKIIAGTTTGFLIRYGCIKSIKAFTHIPKPGLARYKSCLTPKGITDNTTEAFEQYRNALGTLISLGIMVFTNFLIDAPLTKFLTNKFIKHKEEKHEV